MVRDDLILLGVGAGVLIVGAWYLQSRLAAIAEAAPQVVADTAASVIIGTGAVFGIPKTNMTECERALAEGRTWDASFACPAGTFLGSFW